MRLTLTAIACLLASVSLAQEASERISDQQRWTDRVYKWVGDISVDRDELIQRRYAVLMQGNSIFPETVLANSNDGQLKFEKVDVPHEQQFQRVYARHKVEFDYRAFNQISSRRNNSTETDHQVHYWYEFLSAGETTRGRSLLVNGFDRRASPYIDRPVDLTVGKWHQKEFKYTRGFTPYDSFVIPYSFSVDYGYLPESVEQTLFSRFELQTVEPQLGGLMVSKWLRILEGAEWLLKITHDPNKNWMPTEVSLTNGKGWPKNFKMDQHLRMLRWKQVDRFWLPHMVESSENLSGTDRHIGQVVKLQWTVGSQAPDAAFDPKTEDLRQPILDHFGVDFMRIKDGQIMPTPYCETPADLLEEFQKTPKK